MASSQTGEKVFLCGVKNLLGLCISQGRESWNKIPGGRRLKVPAHGRELSPNIL
jgi:hypothetical protein